MERLNTKYNLDCFLDSELDSESDEGEEYKYEHNYETLLSNIEKKYVVTENLLQSVRYINNHINKTILKSTSA